MHVSAFGVTADPSGSAVGTGLYVRAGSFFNHSCVPSASVSFLGNLLRVHTIRPLRAGEPLTIAYTDLYAGRAERHRRLQPP